MMIKNIFLALSTIILALGLSADNTAEASGSKRIGSISAEITNLQNQGKGQLLVMLYQKVNRVEANGVKYFKRQIKPVKGTNMKVTFEDVPYGDYAILIMHDMDKDMIMDTTFIGIPDEDLGISNNVKGGPLGGPKWADAKFSHRSENSVIRPIVMWQCYN